MRVRIVQNNRDLPTVTHQGQQYALAPESGTYEIHLTNDSMSRKLAVVSVDGVNVINGENASYEGSGYVLNAQETVVIKGWLRGNQQAAAFTFDSSENSYAALTGRGTENTGIIGVAVFEEAPDPLEVLLRNPPFVAPTTPYIVPTTYPPFPNPHITWGVSDTSCSTNSAGASRGGILRSVGTGYGEEVRMETTTASFKRKSSTPYLVQTIRYGTESQFHTWGVPVPQPQPNAFPGNNFVPPPPNWKSKTGPQPRR